MVDLRKGEHGRLANKPRIDRGSYPIDACLEYVLLTWFCYSFVWATCGQLLAGQIVRMTLPKGRPSTKQRRAAAASPSGKLLATIGLIAPDLSRETITFQASATAAFGMAVPALFTRTSSRPSVVTVLSTACRTASASAASAWIAIALPPARSISFTTDDAAS